MPNWCSCQLEISGDKKEIEKLLKFSDPKKLSLSFEKLFPAPPDIGENWYDWRVNNWGTKWDINDPIIEDNGDSFTINFETAWGPPIEAFDKISKDFPNIVFSMTYQEPGMDFCGLATYQNGISQNISEGYSTQFGLSIEYDLDNTKIENDIICVPMKITRKIDAYDFESSLVTSNCILNIPKNTEDDELHDSFDDSVTLSSEDDIDDIISEKKDSLINDLYEKLEEIKKIAEYNTLNNEIPVKRATRSKYKL